MDANSGPVVLINPFEVPAAADEQFIAAWEAARDFLAAQDGYQSTALHRSLGPDAEFRFVNVAEWASPADFQAATAQPDFPGRDMPFAAHPGLYEIVREDQPPAEDPGGVVLINAFEVPPDTDDAFLTSWKPAGRSCALSPATWPPACAAASRRRRTSGSSTSVAMPVPKHSRPPSASPGSGRRPRPSSTAPTQACTRSCAADRPPLARRKEDRCAGRRQRSGVRHRRGRDGRRSGNDRNVMADIGRWPDWNPDITVATLHGPVQPGLGSVGRPDRAQSSRPSGSGAADRAVLDWQDDGNPGHPCLPAAR
jgi:heme-degrading monooxygenase HmoA